MTELSVEQAAQFLGVSDVALYKMLRRGELVARSTDPVRIAAADVQAFHRARQVDALRVLERRRQDPVALAVEVRHRLHPTHLPSPNLPGDREREQRFRLSVLPAEAKTLLGLPALKAAASTADGCRWCLSVQLAAADGGWAPREWSAAFGALLGQPCETCAPGLYRAVLDQLAVEVHPGGVRPPEGPPRPSAETMRLAEEWAAEHPVVAAAGAVARPSQDDGGRGLVSRRRREVQARLVAARRRGDTAYVARLTAQLASLVADAARVDGRAVTASARPGRLACGHALSERCGCPRKASR